MYVKEDFRVNVLTTTLERPDYVEDIWLTVQYKNFPYFVIGCVYRHPHALNNSFTYISDIFTSLCLRNKPLLILGDFNDDQFLPDNKIGKISQSLHLTQVIKKDTRITSTPSTLTRTFIKCLDSCAPFVTKEIKRPYAPWIDDQIKDAIKNRNKLHNEFKLNRQDPIAESDYRRKKKAS